MTQAVISDIFENYRGLEIALTELFSPIFLPQHIFAFSPRSEDFNVLKQLFLIFRANSWTSL